MAFVVLSALIAGCGDDAEVDPRLVGSWQTHLPSPQGGWATTFTIETNGHYRVQFAGFPPLPDETGTLTAADGTWHVLKDNGEEDGGAYLLPTETGLTMFGRGGVAYWQRPGQPAPATAGSAAPIAAGQTGEWPLTGVPALARQAAVEAQTWQPDAILIGLEAQLHEGAVIGNFVTPAGQASLSFTFCSPGTGLVRTVQPGASPRVSTGPCDPGRAIPLDFPDLPDVVNMARARGMTSERPNAFELRWQRLLERDQDALAWRVLPQRYVNESAQVIPLEDAVEQVRTVDACAVVTLADAQRATGRDLEAADAPHVSGDATWACAYRAPGNGSTTVRVHIDESPYRDERAVVDRARRQGQERLDIGDEAYFQLPGSGLASLTVLLGDTLIELGVAGAEDTRGATIELGRLAVQRIVAGTAVGSRASLADQLVGTWSTQLHDHRLLLTVRAGDALTLEVATAFDGALGAAAGSWEFVSRARRPILSGSYQLSQPGRLTTAGDVVADWQRVGAPTLVDRRLIAVADSSGGPWPEPSLEPTVRGNWEATGTLNGRTARLLWQIGAPPHRLTAVVSGNGYVTRGRAGHDTAVLHFSEQLQRDAEAVGVKLGASERVIGLDKATDGNQLLSDWRGEREALRWRLVEPARS